jgi:hypothetical protein
MRPCWTPPARLLGEMVIERLKCAAKYATLGNGTRPHWKVGQVLRCISVVSQLKVVLASQLALGLAPPVLLSCAHYFLGVKVGRFRDGRSVRHDGFSTLKGKPSATDRRCLAHATTHALQRQYAESAYGEWVLGCIRAGVCCSVFVTLSNLELGATKPRELESEREAAFVPDEVAFDQRVSAAEADDDPTVGDGERFTRVGGLCKRAKITTECFSCWAGVKASSALVSDSSSELLSTSTS